MLLHVKYVYVLYSDDIAVVWRWVHSGSHNDRLGNPTTSHTKVEKLLPTCIGGLCIWNPNCQSATIEMLLFDEHCSFATKTAWPPHLSQVSVHRSTCWISRSKYCKPCRQNPTALLCPQIKKNVTFQVAWAGHWSIAMYHKTIGNESVIVVCVSLNLSMCEWVLRAVVSTTTVYLRENSSMHSDGMMLCFFSCTHEEPIERNCGTFMFLLFYLMRFWANQEPKLLTLAPSWTPCLDIINGFQTCRHHRILFTAATRCSSQNVRCSNGIRDWWNMLST